MKKIKKKIVSKETRKKLSDALKNYWRTKASKEHKEKLREVKQTEEFRNTMSEVMLKRYDSKKYRKNIKKKLKKCRKKAAVHKKVILKRPNDYCGVVSMSDYLEMING